MLGSAAPTRAIHPPDAARRPVVAPRVRNDGAPVCPRPARDLIVTSMLSLTEKTNILRSVSLFAETPDDILAEVAALLEEVVFKVDDTIFEKGDAGDAMYIIVEGRVRVHWRGRTLNYLEQHSVFGEMAVLDPEPRSATVTAVEDTALLRLDRAPLYWLINSRPEVATGIIHILCQRLRARATNVVEDYHAFQREKLVTLGRLSAGLAHELNNPASATGQGAAQLKDAIAQLHTIQLRLAEFNLSRAQLDALLALDQVVQQRAQEPAALDALARYDREHALETWLSEQGIDIGWETTPNLVDLGYDTEALAALMNTFPDAQAPAVLAWLSTTYTIYSLLAEIGQGAARISELVQAFKRYTYMDQAPIQNVDIHEGLDNTLVILRNKLKSGITVHRVYASDLPHIQAYGGDLNQVWTNIVDNAIAALGGQGEITVRTRRDDPWVAVEIEDTGPGIPEAIQANIFDPFFTTKPLGEGSGLGLNISHNIIVEKHKGMLDVTSQPGKTCFQIRLPITGNLAG